MPPIPQSRIKRLIDVVREIDRILRTGDGSGDFRGLLAEASEGTVLMNRTFAELSELIGKGLRDEAISMYDPQLIDLARALDLTSRPDWIRVHGWMLEHGLSSPPPVDLGLAETVAVASEELAFLRPILDRVRWTVLARRPTREKLTVLRELDESDPGKALWAETVREHEAQRLRELSREIPVLVERLDAVRLASIRQELLDDRWRSAIPFELLEATDGADLAASLAEADRRVGSLMAELERIDARTGGVFDDWEEPVGRARDELSGLFSEAERSVDEIGMGVTESRNPAKNLQHDLAHRILARRDESADMLRRVDAFRECRDAQRGFGDQCRLAEYLCEHPPSRGGEGKWAADLDRCEVELTRLCQERSDLQLPTLLQHRIRTARQAVIDERDRKNRFRVVASVMVAAVCLTVVVTTGGIVWSRSQRMGMIDLLSQRIEEAESGWYTERPESVERFAGRFSSDPGVLDLVEQFDDYVRAEQERRERFAGLIEEHEKMIQVMQRHVAEVEAVEGVDRIRALPVVFDQGRENLRKAEAIRDAEEVSEQSRPAKAREYFQFERERLEKAKLRQVTQESRLTAMAAEAFNAERERIVEALAIAAEQKDRSRYRMLLLDVAALKKRASVPKYASDGRSESSDEAAADTVIAKPLLMTLEPLIQRLESLLK